MRYSKYKLIYYPVFFLVNDITLTSAIFGIRRLKSAKYVIFGLGKLNLWHIIKLHRIRFIFHLLRLSHRIMYNLLYVYVADHYRVDDYSAFTLRTLSDATRVVYEPFAANALWWNVYYYSRFNVISFSYFFVLCLPMAHKNVY